MMESKATCPNPSELMEQCARHRDTITMEKTEQNDCQWIVRYIRFFENKMHPRDLGPRDVERFLSDLAVRGKVSAPTLAPGPQRPALLDHQALDNRSTNKIQPTVFKERPMPPTVCATKSTSSTYRGDPCLMAKTDPRRQASTDGVRALKNQRMWTDRTHPCTRQGDKRAHSARSHHFRTAISSNGSKASSISANLCGRFVEDIPKR